MQFLIVWAKKRGSEEFENGHPVLIDGEKNGVVNCSIKLDEGTVDVSVDAPGADETTVDIENTTQENPLWVIIEVD